MGILGDFVDWCESRAQMRRNQEWLELQAERLREREVEALERLAEREPHTSAQQQRQE